MLITKNTPLSVLNDGNVEKIYIDKEVSLDTALMEKLLSSFPNSQIIIKTTNDLSSSNIEANILYNNDELQILAGNVNMARTKFEKDISFDEEFSVEQAITASKKLNEWTDLINSTTVNGEPLSPLEKYTLAYGLVSNRFYSKENTETQKSAISRNIISVLSDDYIVCAGFANVLCNLCYRIGIPCAYRECAVNSKDENGGPVWDNHANCIVRIEDPKYKVSGLYNADPTWDCIKNEYKDNWDLLFNFNFKHFLISHNDYTKIFDNIELDSYVKSDGIHDKRRPRNKVDIFGIEHLFAHAKQPNTFNSELFDPETNDLDINKIKQQAYDRFLKHLEPADHEIELMDDYIESVSEQIACYFLNSAILYTPDEEEYIIPYMEDYINNLNCCLQPENLKELIASKIDNYNNQEITNMYASNYEHYTRNIYQTYKRMFDNEKETSKSIDEQTLRKLFGNLAPILFDIKPEGYPVVVNKLIASCSPITLMNEAKQKTTD